MISSFLLFALFLFYPIQRSICLVPTGSTTSATSVRPSGSSSAQNVSPETVTFSVSLDKARPKASTFVGTVKRLWNDPRPVTSLVNDAVSSSISTGETEESIPYCIVSDAFEVFEETFEVLLYPRGRFASETAKSRGPAGVYLKYVPQKYGDEVDIAWKLRLIDTRSGDALPIFSSGGLPKSNDTWSGAMTFCSEREGIESVGRSADWGSSAWFAENVCDALGHISAQGEITLFDRRTGESSVSWPPKGAIAAVIRAANEATTEGRTFRAGEVIVPMSVKDANVQKALDESFIVPGTDYRIMTIADKDGNPIFSTESLPEEERQQVRLAVRPTGWKVQQQLWRKRGMKTEWPMEVPADLLSNAALTRFNAATAVPRVASMFQRDFLSVLVALLLAFAPIPLALLGRNFVSVYGIPTASMEPTIQKGDVILVEKFPRVLDRTSRGDVVFFTPPSALNEVIGQTNANAIASQKSLFVKRIVGFPGDTDILMDTATQEVQIGGVPAMGPDRNLCDDEPLRLIDRLLEDGKGKSLQKLGDEDVYVLGDCKAVSIDSRVFGPLPKSNVVGRPLARIWPLSRVFLGPL